MPRRYNGAIYKDSVGALLQQKAPGGFAGNDDRRCKSGARVKNYSLDNRANIKEIQAQNRQRKEEEEAPAAEPFKLRQFKNVKSRFASSAPPTASEVRSSAPGSAESKGTGRHFLRRGSREKVATELRQEAVRRRREDEAAAAANATATSTATGSRKSSEGKGSPPNRAAFPGAGLSAGVGPGGALAASSGAGPYGAAPSSGRREGRAGSGTGAETEGSIVCRWGAGVTPKKEAVPKAAEVARLAPRSSRDFVTANRVRATEMKARNVSDEGGTFTHDSYGRVPDYLVSRQEEWEREAERRRAEAPDPSCPPGMKLMPEEERLKTLGLLQENELACQAQLNKFPLVVQTPLLRRRVDDLNEKLKEIDAAKAIFGRARGDEAARRGAVVAPCITVVRRTTDPDEVAEGRRGIAVVEYPLRN
eukprot:jgi/Undpi1/5501/HiC_scaffold_2.g00780.m1